jgi:hypothetical protein
VFHSPSEQPAQPDTQYAHDVVLAVRVLPSVAGALRAFRFYLPASAAAAASASSASGEPAAHNHTLRLYRAASAELLHSVALPLPTACAGAGWVSSPLPQPLTLQAGLEYTLALEGVRHVAKTDLYFPRSGQGLTRGSLTFLGSLLGHTPGQLPSDSTVARTDFFLDGEPLGCRHTTAWAPLHRKTILVVWCFMGVRRARVVN